MSGIQHVVDHVSKQTGLTLTQPPPKVTASRPSRARGKTTPSSNSTSFRTPERSESGVHLDESGPGDPFDL